jgi:hypothetical protein
LRGGGLGLLGVGKGVIRSRKLVSFLPLIDFHLFEIGHNRLIDSYWFLFLDIVLLGDLGFG